MRTHSRRLARFGALSVVAALALGGPLAGAAIAGGNQDPETLATLHIDEDNVEVRKDGEDEFEAAEDDQKLEEGDTVRTDETGRAEVQYGDESYTYLDFDTTFTIVELTDDQGNRKVEGSLDTGRTWNRAEGLTESESFEQSGAGATAAVQGTAFAIQCVTEDDCDFAGAVDDIALTGANEGQVLLTLDLCKALSGDLCDQLSKLGPGELFDFMQQMLLRDLLVHGLGPGPFPGFTGTIAVENGVLTITQTSSTTSGQTLDVLAGDPIGCDFSCDSTEIISFELPEGFVPGSSITVFDDDPDEVHFVANLTVSPAGLFVVFTSVPSDDNFDTPDIAELLICDEDCVYVQVGVQYPADQVFVLDGDNPGETSFTFHVEDGAGTRVSPDATVPVVVEPCEFCGGESLAQEAPPPDTRTEDPPPATESQG